MPTKPSPTPDAAAAAVEQRRPRLPSFGAEATLGPPSRAYRPLMASVSTGSAAVAPSQWDDATDEGADDGDDDTDDDGAEIDADDESATNEPQAQD